MEMFGWKEIIFFATFQSASLTAKRSIKRDSIIPRAKGYLPFQGLQAKSVILRGQIAGPTSRASRKISNIPRANSYLPFQGLQTKSVILRGQITSPTSRDSSKISIITRANSYLPLQQFYGNFNDPDSQTSEY